MNKRQRELQASWEKVLAASAKPLEKGAKAKPAKASSSLPSKIPKLVIPTDRNSRNLPSFDSGKGSTALPQTVQYTGDKIIGLATMHKSNMVPIFNHEAAEDVAKMRR